MVGLAVETTSRLVCPGSLMESSVTQLSGSEKELS